MTKKHLTAIVSLFALGCLWYLANILTDSTPKVLLQVKAFPLLQDQAMDLEEQTLDFRYAPKRWQTCIGLPDDPHKSIVGSDGALYYDYGGGRFYDFHVRVRANLETDGDQGGIMQRLRHPRVPVVITEQHHGALTLRQTAWAAAPKGHQVDQWSKRRVDYLWLELENQGSTTQRGRMALKIDSGKRLYIDPDMQQVRYSVDDRVFCRVWAPFVSLDPPIQDKDGLSKRLLPRRLPAVSRDWGKPNITCGQRFKDVLIGYNRPLAFTFPAEPGQRYRVAFGLIESEYEHPGKRLLDLHIEGQSPRQVDLITDYGSHCPVVLTFPAEDRNGDGLLELGVYPVDHAEDQNTILTALWVFPADDVPTDQQIRLGQGDSRALAVYDALSRLGHPLRLYFSDTVLQPHEKEQILVAFYRGSEAKSTVSVTGAQQELDRAVHYWQQESDLPFNRIQVPDPTMQALLDACIRNIYQARELRNGKPAFQVGPTSYRGTWAADGPFILEAVTYLGRAAEARAGLELQVRSDEGPSGVVFSKKTGLRLWMIMRHWQLTGDRPWLETMWPHIQFNVDKIIEYRRLTRQDPNQANCGLMPIGFGDGGLGGRHREYTNVHWTLAGLKAAIDMASHLKKPIASAWQAEFNDYRLCFDKARHRDTLSDVRGNVYVPVTMKGEEPQLPQRGAWTFLQSIYPGNLFTPDDALMRGTLAMLDAHAHQGLILGTGWDPAGIWTYAGSFYGHAHLWLGHGRKAAATCYAYANHACPLGCWREEQNPKDSPEKYIGDMPHNWASAEFIRLIRHLLILERGHELHLLEGMPLSWSYPGAVIRLTDMPTQFGPMSLFVHMQPDGKNGVIRIIPPERERLEKIVLHLEHFNRPISSMQWEGREIAHRTVSINSTRECVLSLDIE
jgi:hypothetical protein